MIDHLVYGFWCSRVRVSNESFASLGSSPRPRVGPTFMRTTFSSYRAPRHRRTPNLTTDSGGTRRDVAVATLACRKGKYPLTRKGLILAA